MRGGSRCIYRGGGGNAFGGVRGAGQCGENKVRLEATVVGESQHKGFAGLAAVDLHQSAHRLAECDRCLKPPIKQMPRGVESYQREGTEDHT